MSNGKPQITKIEAIGIIATIILGIITYHQGTNIETLQKEKQFSETLSSAIDYLSSDSPISRRMAVVSLTNSAKTDEQIKEVIKVIIIAANSQETQQDNSYQILLNIASLEPEKEKKIKQALGHKDIKTLLKLFPPFPVTTQPTQLPPEIKAGEEKVTLNTTTQQLIDEQANQVKNLVAKIYSTDKSQRQSAVSELSLEKYRPYDEIMVGTMLDKFEQNPQNYFGIVNSLFLLSKVDISDLQSNREAINELVVSAQSILNPSDTTQYLDPIKDRLKTLSR